MVSIVLGSVVIKGKKEVRLSDVLFVGCPPINLHNNYDDQKVESIFVINLVKRFGEILLFSLVRNTLTGKVGNIPIAMLC